MQPYRSGVHVASVQCNRLYCVTLKITDALGWMNFRADILPTKLEEISSTPVNRRVARRLFTLQHSHAVKGV